MKKQEFLKQTCLINQKAQSILELAIFGSMVLFCLYLLIHFGLQMNYQQNVQMQAFRKALKLAYFKQGPSSQASLLMIKDKPVVDPRDRWGFSDRTPVGSGAAVTWSNTLNSLYVNSILTNPDDRDLPVTYIEINNEDNINKKSGGIGLADNEINDNLDKNRPPFQTTKGIFTTADFRYKYVSDLYRIGVYMDNSRYRNGPKEYYPISLDLARDIKVFRDPQDPQQKYAAYEDPLDSRGLKRALTSVVFIHSAAEQRLFEDGKLRPINIIAVWGSLGNNCRDDGYCGRLTHILYMDSSRGQIDPYYMDVKPWDSDKNLANKQSVLLDYKKELNYNSGASITTTETNTSISTKTNSNATQTITHKIRRNDGTTTEVPATFRPTQNYNYQVKQ